MFPFNATENNFEFNCALFNYAYNSTMNADTVKNQQQLHLTKGLIICDDIDSGKYFYHQYNNLGNKYYVEDDFNQLLENNIATNFALLHVNSRSLFKTWII